MLSDGDCVFGMFGVLVSSKDSSNDRGAGAEGVGAKARGGETTESSHGTESSSNSKNWECSPWSCCSIFNSEGRVGGRVEGRVGVANFGLRVFGIPEKR
jgi:hypothetical protein